MAIPERAITLEQIIQRLGATLERGEPIVAVGAGVGIIAKVAEVAKADMIVVHANSRSRNLGVPTTTHLGNPTQMVLDMYPEIDNVVDDTPIVCGIDATDGMRRRLGRLVDHYKSIGINGVSNFPTTVGAGGGGWGKARMDVGMGVDREWELMTLARDAGLLAVGNAHVPEMAKELTASGADVIIVRLGLTIGGDSGPREGMPGVLMKEEEVELVNASIEAVRSENKDTFVIAHGGHLGYPEATEYLYANTDVQGVLSESAIERIAVETYVQNEIARFKSPTLRGAFPPNHA